MSAARCGLTLLEAVVALALLGAVATASLSLRGASVAAAARIERRLAAAQAADATLRMALAGVLFERSVGAATGAGEADRDAAVFARWEGRTMGLACICERELVRAPMPRSMSAVSPGAQAPSEESSRQLRAIRFAARCAGEEATIVAPAP